jgi:hypothetical protein
MAYQNVGTPRFYVNIPEWLASTGAVIDPVFRTLPVSASTITGMVGMAAPSFFVHEELKHFIAILGHSIATNNDIWSLSTEIELDPGEGMSDVELGIDDIINVGYQANTPQWYAPNYNGFTIGTVAAFGMAEVKFKTQTDQDIGSVILGAYYDMPHSPDLKLTMTREMDGVKRIRTKGGADLVGHKYTKPPAWGEAGAWELYSGTPSNKALSRSGRRVWDLSFSYLQDSDLFPVISSLHTYESYNSDGELYTDPTDITILRDNTFYNQVIHKTNGGQLPFIFQPDRDNNNPDQFAICKLDMNSFKFEQVAKNIYNIKLKIREVW